MKRQVSLAVLADDVKTIAAAFATPEHQYRREFEPQFAFAPSSPFDQAATHNRCCKFARQAAVKASELPDGYEFQRSEFEGTALYQLFKLSYGHLVQATGHLSKSCCSVCLKGRSPTDQSFLGEY